MIIIGFSGKTSKILPRIFCGKLKHVAPILQNESDWGMFQFIRRGNVVCIPLNNRDIKVLSAHGWQFVYINDITLPHGFNAQTAWTCVQLAKRAIGMRKWWIQTPNALYRDLKRRDAC